MCFVAHVIKVNKSDNESKENLSSLMDCRGDDVHDQLLELTASEHEVVDMKIDETDTNSSHLKKAVDSNQVVRAALSKSHQVESSSKTLRQKYTDDHFVDLSSTDVFTLLELVLSIFETNPSFAQIHQKVSLLYCGVFLITHSV